MFSTRSCAWAVSVAIWIVPLPSVAAAGEREKPAEKPRAQILVEQALDNELAGDAEGRETLLNQAAAADPQHPPAHWHLGRVRVGDEWLAANAAMTAAADDAISAEYGTRRDEAAGNAALELKLAQWCLKENMPDRARLHFWRVLTNPKVTEGQVKDAARQLDLVSVGGMILTRDELKQEQQRERKIAEAIARWRPILAQLQPAIDGGFGEEHDAGAAKLAAIDDPSVIPAVETFLKGHREGFGEELVKLLAKFPQVEATQTLVRYAVVSPYLGVREESISELKQRPLHDYVPTLLLGLVAPIESQFRAEVDRRGNIRYRHRFAQDAGAARFVFDQQLNLQPVMHSTTTVMSPAHGPGGSTQISTITLGPEVALLELSVQASAKELAVFAANEKARANNDSVYQVLEQATSQQLPPKVDQWWQWWQEYNQVNYPRPTYYRFQQARRTYAAAYQSGVRYHSCFIAGTPVWTETGLRAIESVQAGDRVLSQDAETGALSFKVVRFKTVTPPSDASQLTVNGEAITTTLGHPLWVAGKGWEMAKHIQSGDQLHGIGGIVNVNAIEPLGRKVEAHNLVVDDFNTYFVGNCGMLVHDNTYRKPTRALLPGLIPSDE